MDNLIKFIESNTRTIKKTFSPYYKSGIHDIESYEQIKIDELRNDEKFIYDFLSYKIKNNNHEYKRNLLENYERIKDSFLKCSVLIELNELKEANFAIEALKKEHKLKINVIGAAAEYKNFNRIKNDALFIEISDFEDEQNEEEIQSQFNSINNRKKYKFETNEYFFTDQKAFGLNQMEQKIILLIIMYHLKCNEIQKDNLHFEYAKTYLDRLLFIYNEEFKSKNLIISHLKNSIYKETNNMPINIEFDKQVPFILNIDYFEKLADNLFRVYHFQSALNIYQNLNDSQKMVSCYIGMGKEKEMCVVLEKIQKELERKLGIENITKENNKNKIVHSNPLDYEDSNTNIENIDSNKEQKNKVSESNVHLNQKDNNNSFSELKFNLINTYHLQAELKKNTSFYTKSYNLHNSFKPLYLESLFLINLKDYKKAYETLKKSLIHTENNIQILHTLACLSNILNLDGEKYFKKILILEPNNYQTLLNLAQLKIEQNDFKEAVFYLKKAFDIYPNKSLEKSIKSLIEKDCSKVEGIEL